MYITVSVHIILKDSFDMKSVRSQIKNFRGSRVPHEFGIDYQGTCYSFEECDVTLCSVLNESLYLKKEFQ